jgi:hypothetical protein
MVMATSSSLRVLQLEDLEKFKGEVTPRALATWMHERERLISMLGDLQSKGEHKLKERTEELKELALAEAKRADEIKARADLAGELFHTEKAKNVLMVVARERTIAQLSGVLISRAWLELGSFESIPAYLVSLGKASNPEEVTDEMRRSVSITDVYSKYVVNLVCPKRSRGSPERALTSRALEDLKLLEGTAKALKAKRDVEREIPQLWETLSSDVHNTRSMDDRGVVLDGPYPRNAALALVLLALQRGGVFTLDEFVYYSDGHPSSKLFQGHVRPIHRDRGGNGESGSGVGGVEAQGTSGGAA